MIMRTISILFLLSHLLDSSSAFTALETDNHPCKAENMKWSKRYTCDGHGKIICQAGWREPEIRDSLNDLNPCLEPICDDNGTGCLHGECRAPNYCACEVGWAAFNARQHPASSSPRSARWSLADPWQRCLVVGLVALESLIRNTNRSRVPRPRLRSPVPARRVPRNRKQREGTYCDKCLPLPGCVHGSCVNAFDCNCEDGWTGAYCDIAECDNCINGDCVAPGECVCHEGWLGENCTQCQAMPGCVHGDCGTHPHTCVCQPGWEGHLCDKPICNPPCVHGFCRTITHPNQTIENFCMCDNGWRAPGCDKCRPYWHCPNQDFNACDHPNECFCYGTESDPDSLCNNTLLLQSNHNNNNNNNNNNNGEKSLNLNKFLLAAVPGAFDGGRII